MARLTGPPPFVGTRFGITIYEMWGEYYMRTKTSLDAERVKNDPAYRPLMKYAAMLSCASRIAAEVYRLLPANGKKHSLYRTITGAAMKLLKQQKAPEEVGQLLLNEYVLCKKLKNSSRSSFTGTNLQPAFNGFCFAGEYYFMPEFSKLLSTLNSNKRRRKRKPNCQL